MDEEATLAVTARGTSNVKHFVAGHKLTLKRHFSSDGEYVLASVTHRASFGADYRSGKDPLLTYQNDFTCFPSALPFRPKRTHGQARRAGEPDGGGRGAEGGGDLHRQVRAGEGPVPLGPGGKERRGQLLLGPRGPARGGTALGSVLLAADRAGGDRRLLRGGPGPADHRRDGLQRRPDAAVPRGRGPTRKHKNDNKVSGFKSNTTKGGQGFNELRFDDTKDKEQVFVHAEKNMDTRVKSDSMESVGSDEARDGGRGEGREEVRRVPRAHLQGQARHRRQHAPGEGRGREGRWSAGGTGKGTSTSTSRETPIRPWMANPT